MSEPALAHPEIGTLTFTLQSRVLRELGERLVRQPEVALLELVKNAYDADATTCEISLTETRLSIKDNGNGMPFGRFEAAWMIIGTNSKAKVANSARYRRPLTGEKGIGRFAVRFLGGKLRLITTAWDDERGCKTRLFARFDWKRFDRGEDIGQIPVRYRLERMPDDAPTGTVLDISHLRIEPETLRWKEVRTGALAVMSGLPAAMVPKDARRKASDRRDPGFQLSLDVGTKEEPDLLEAIRSYFVLRAEIELNDTKATIRIFRRGSAAPYLEVSKTMTNPIAPVLGDIRFFPRRAGTFRGAAVKGPDAYGWLRENSGVKVYDQGFQMRPYGMRNDDWLGTDADANRNQRDPRSSFMQDKPFRMDREQRADPAENWMLRLPESAQLHGIVHVRGSRSSDGDANGLVAAADREGFVDNAAFHELQDLVRGALEMMAYADRQIQREEDLAKAERVLAESRTNTEAAIREIETDPALANAQKAKIVTMLVASQERIERHEVGTRERERQLEIMSLLGVIGGFMTHEFATASETLRQATIELDELSRDVPDFGERAVKLRRHSEALRAFVEYSGAYIRGAKTAPKKPYAALPRLRQINRVFGKYAEDRDIVIDVEVDPKVMVPLIPAALYNGVAQNLLTNALKAVVMKRFAAGEDRRVAMRAWNDDRYHRLQVSDTGVGIPPAVRGYVFDPLFTTTEDMDDPLGSGMGLGLALVKRGAKAFGGDAAISPAPPGFVTCVEVRFPLENEQD